MKAIAKGISVSFSGRGRFSAFSLTDRSIVTEQGFAYSLTEAVLDNGFPLGVSNEFTGNEAEIRVQEGEILIIYDRENLNSYTDVL